ncbi:S9 family peptidase [Acanthopleuribacter pedis]|uniref:DPP IV N-terminal domain-containing protein n=1 Tax=Acanthopleuribacter pedis TaxID=442870 RepID=A0A8J7U0C1_9BACT|nr:S9 family peptidase [Acanthopleuribacter pedis]MBO1316923.1 DPP IV N-terminal domain-containing protein [Acanthopleuribacter pedis]
MPSIPGRLGHLTRVFAALLCVATLQAETLTIDRIYSDPSLSGPSLKDAAFSPDGKRITFLKEKTDDFTVLDLWSLDLASGQTGMFVDSQKITGGTENLSDEEKARRERMRLFQSGIVDYSWSEDSKRLLFPLGGDLYVYEPASGTTRQLTKTDAFETDARFSPKGRYVSFIRKQNLYVIDIQSGRETAITTEGKDTIKYGMAEFVAQEEMGRYTGYWWAPDDSALAFARVDESPVQISKRSEIYADDFKVISQRYPYTGTNNATVTLHVRDVAGGERRQIDLGTETDIYLARVNWFPNSKKLLVQRQSRDQRTLDLLVAERATGNSKTLVQETSTAWINLHDEIYFFKNKPWFIWASERDGFQHLYLYHINGELVHQLTQGAWMVNHLLGVDEDAGHIYYEGTAESPLERHAYRLKINTTGKPLKTQRITQGEGMHAVTVSPDSATFIDTFSNPNQPVEVKVYRTKDLSLVTVLQANPLDESHPYHPYWAHHSQAEYGTLKAEDGQDLYYSLIKPVPFDPAKKYPVLVDVYGGPGAQKVTKGWGSRYYLWLQYMAQRGYVVFTLDNRGSANRGTAFEFPIHRRLGDVEVKDQQVGIEYLRSLPYVNGEKIGIFGWSYGGYMTIMAMMRAPKDFAAGVSVAPVTDWGLYDTHYTERYLDHPKGNADGYESSNVFAHIDGLQGPLFIIHGMADDNVLFTHATKLYKALQDRDMPFEMMNYPGKKHRIWGIETRKHLFKATTAFFDKHLK